MRILRIAALIDCALLFCLAFSASAADCSDPPAKTVNLDAYSSRSLLSPDGRWKFATAAARSSEQAAGLRIENMALHHRWNVGSIERSGMAFWSEDSKRLFFRDQYVADDTRIRVFDLSGAAPSEFKGLNAKIQSAILAHIPRGKMTLWQYFPKACFAANDSNTAIILADLPLASKTESGPGKKFGLKLTVDFTSLRVLVEPSTPDSQ